MLAIAARLACLVAVISATTAAADDRPSVSYVVVIDRSTSMRGDKLEVVASTVLHRIEGLDPGDRVAIVSFGKTATVVSPLRAPDPAQLERELAAIRADNGNDLVAGLDKAAELLSNVTGPKHVVLITDNDNFTKKTLEPALVKLRGQSISIGAIGILLREPRALGALGAISTDAVDDLEMLPRALTRAFHVPILMRNAVAIVIDRSGSMNGVKLEAAKEAARVCLEVMSPTDLITVIAFDTAAQTVVDLQKSTNRLRIASDLARLESGGGTNIMVGLRAAFDALKSLNYYTKHVILLTDGESPHDGVPELVAGMKKHGFTVSAVGMQGADRAVLTEIATAGDGRLYMVEDLGALPKIFMREASH